MLLLLEGKERGEREEGGREDEEKEKRPSPGGAQNRKSWVFKLLTPNDRF